MNMPSNIIFLPDHQISKVPAKSVLSKREFGGLSTIENLGHEALAVCTAGNGAVQGTVGGGAM
jgi:hypothetical protein